MTWNAQTLQTIGSSEEIAISSYRKDGSLRRWTPIWVVRAGDELFIRSAFGTEGGWYRWAMTNRTARIRANGIETDVSLVPAVDPSTNSAVDAAYTEKYRRQPGSLRPMIAPTAAATTVRVDPRESE